MKKFILKTSIAVLAVICLLASTLTAVLAESAPTDEELYEIIDRELACERIAGEIIVTFKPSDNTLVAVDAMKELNVDWRSSGKRYYSYLSGNDQTGRVYLVVADDTELRDLMYAFLCREEVASVAHATAKAGREDPYAGLTDAEIYEKIDRALSVDREPNELIVIFGHATTREMAQQVFESVGLQNGENGGADINMYRYSFGGGAHESMFYMAYVEEELMREYMFRLIKSDLVVSVGPNEIVILDYYIVGDVDGDEEVNAKDYMMLKRAVLGTYTLNKSAAADIDGDGNVNAKDYMMLKRKVLGTFD